MQFLEPFFKSETAVQLVSLVARQKTRGDDVIKDAVRDGWQVEWIGQTRFELELPDCCMMSCKC